MEHQGKQQAKGTNLVIIGNNLGEFTNEKD